MPRAIIGITLAIWLTVGTFLVLISRQPFVILVPIYGLCPLQLESGGADYHPALLALWGIFAGLVFLVTAFFGWFRNSKEAAAWFAILFVVSTVLVFGRIAADLSGLH
jgi:hypothetical protein